MWGGGDGLDVAKAAAVEEGKLQGEGDKGWGEKKKKKKKKKNFWAVAAAASVFFFFLVLLKELVGKGKDRGQQKGHLVVRF